VRFISVCQARQPTAAKKAVPCARSKPVRAARCPLSQIAALILSGLAFIGSVSAAQLPRSMLILGQSDPGTPWYIALNQALRSTLNANPASRVTVYSEDLDLANLKRRRGNPPFEPRRQGV
jgi:hypothetical protein